MKGVAVTAYSFDNHYLGGHRWIIDLENLGPSDGPEGHATHRVPSRPGGPERGGPEGRDDELPTSHSRHVSPPSVLA